MSMPKRADETALWAAFGDGAAHRWPREAAAEMGMPGGRLEYLCNKWSAQGIYDWGTSCDLGWKVE